MHYRIGVDVGGTNTDAVLAQGSTIITSVKSSTTNDVESGIIASVKRLLAQASVEPQQIGAVMIGTTQFTNALVQRRGLSAVATVRLCLPSNTAIPIGAGWPQDIREALDITEFMLHGGHNFDGREISPLRDNEIDGVIETIRAAGITAVAVNGTFSTVSASHELEVARRIREALPNVTISLGHQIGRIGLLERENAAIVNASSPRSLDEPWPRLRTPSIV
jgi:N-methylhydantoinase A/oxoprolinase/acetone carboxylase beta subunit